MFNSQYRSLLLANFRVESCEWISGLRLAPVEELAVDPEIRGTRIKNDLEPLARLAQLDVAVVDGIVARRDGDRRPEAAPVAAAHVLGYSGPLAMRRRQWQPQDVGGGTGSP